MIIVTRYVMVDNELCECEMLCYTWDVLFWHEINVKVWNLILWLNPWDKLCYTMSGKIMWIVLKLSLLYLYYICVRVYVCAYLFSFTYLGMW